MRMTVSTPAVLGILKGYTRPFNFVFVPLLFQHSQSKGKEKLSLLMPFSKHRDQWLKTIATDTRTGEPYPICLLDPIARTKKVEVKCYGNILGEYRNHPEAKFLGPDGIPCHSQTSGLLQRSEIVVERIRYIGKETSRRWEQGDDPSLVDFRCTEYAPDRVVADLEVRTKIIEIGIRRITHESNINRKTVRLIANGGRVKASTLAKVVAFLQIFSV